MYSTKYEVNVLSLNLDCYSTAVTVSAVEIAQLLNTNAIKVFLR